MNKKNIFFFAALGAGVLGIVFALIAGITGLHNSTDGIPLDFIANDMRYTRAVIAGVMLLAASVLAIIGTGYIFRKNFISTGLLGIAGILAMISLMNFGIFGLLAGLFCLVAAALTVMPKFIGGNAQAPTV